MTVTLVQPKAFIFLTKKLTRIKKVTIKSSTVAVPKTVVNVRSGQAA